MLARMLALYLICSIVGGGLVAFAAVGGDADGGDGDLGSDGALDAAVPHGGAGGGGSLGEVVLAKAGHRNGLVAAILSLRFWMFFGAFFGWTGLALYFLAGMTGLVGAGLASSVGLFAAGGMSAIMAAIRRNEADSSVRAHHVIGSEATVLLPIDGDRPGKVRIEVGGRQLDYLAVLDSPGRLERGAKAVVLAEEGERLRVTAADEFLPDVWPNSETPKS
jgi:membrane protein implicated in regulation of membrane protease activity